jgi:hypothetical protein
LPASRLPEGIDAIDYQLLLRFIPDGEQIDLQAIRQLSAVVGDVPFAQQLQNLQRLQKYVVEMSILAALLVLMILTTGNKEKFFFLLIYAGFITLLIIHVSLDGFLKNRVFLCMLMPLLGTYFMLLPNTTGLKRRWGIGIAMMVLAGWYGYQVYNERITSAHARYMWNEWQEPLLERVPEGAYVTTIGTYMAMEAMNPWHIWPYGFHKYTLGWQTWSPLNKPLGHSYRALLSEDMYIFTDYEGYQKPRTALPRVCEQIEKHYGVPTEIVWKCHNYRYAVVKLKIKE